MRSTLGAIARGLVLLLVLTSVFSAGRMFAACHVVTPSGSGTRSGADWNNAMANLPATLIRGDIYYLSDGTYGNYVFNTSGTTPVEIRKAQTYDHCTDTGWNASTMGSGQAVFNVNRQFIMQTGYLILNGNGTQTAPGCGGAPGATQTSSPPNPIDCGIKLDDTTCSGGTDACDSVIDNGAYSPTNYTVKYVEIVGNGDNGSNEMLIRGGGDSNDTYNHIYGHNAGCVYFQYGGQNRTVSYSYFWGTEVNGAAAGCHGQYAYYAGSDSNSTEHHNVYRDITGTAVWTFANSSTTHSSWLFYDNVIVATSNSTSLGHLSDGVIACINAGTNCTNFSFYDNSIINVGGQSGINNENTGSYTVRNNLWYHTDTATGGTNFASGTGGTFTQDHNSFLAQGASCVSGTANVCDGSASNPFTNYPANGFNLLSDLSDWNNRVSLGSPYDTDAAGNTFTSDRGAYQFVSASAPNPPTGLVATVQ